MPGRVIKIIRRATGGVLARLDGRISFTTITCEGLLTVNDIEFAIVALGFAVVNGELDEVANLRRARQLALSHGQFDLAALAARALATIRSGDDFALRLDFASRTRSFVQPELPTAPAAQVRIRGASVHPRPCD